MRTLPTVTIQASGLAGDTLWKVYFPYENEGIRAKLEELGMVYDHELRAFALPISPALVEQARTALQDLAFVVVKYPKQVAQSFAEPITQNAFIENNSQINGKLEIHASLVMHKGEERIKIVAPNNAESKGLLRQLSGSRWSQTMQCWHIPKTGEAWQALEAAFPNVVVEKNGTKETVAPAVPEINKEATVTPTNDIVTAKFSGLYPDRVFLQVPWQQQEWVAFVKILPGAVWMPSERLWSLPRTDESKGLCRAFFGKNLVVDKESPLDLTSFPSNPTKPSPLANRLPFREISADNANPFTTAPPAANNQKEGSFPFPSETRQSFPAATAIKPSFTMVTKDGISSKSVAGKTVIVEPWDSHWCCAFVPGNRQDWVDKIKNIPGRRWNVNSLAWLLPMTQETVRDLSDLFGNDLCLSLSFPETLPDRWVSPYPRYERKTVEDRLNDMQRLAITALEEKLILESKLYRTIKSYKNLLAGLLLHYPQERPSKITTKQIQAYIIYKRKESKLSNSAINGLISALNAFYGRAINQPEKVQPLERPKKTRTLPNVLSPEEVQELINAVDNAKHKCMLLLIYSAGLRKSEVLSLRVRDLNVARQTLFVKSGKGNKDRFSFYPPQAIKHVSAYIEKYKPKYWLFEGQTGDKYSESGLQAIFEEARQKSKVNPMITIHGLRHSFATHLVEGNVPLHVVKQLLGHEDIKTTEVYLHISNKYMKEIKSPLENLEI